MKMHPSELAGLLEAGGESICRQLDGVDVLDALRHAVRRRVGLRIFSGGGH